MGGAGSDRRLEIAAHAHRQAGKAHPARQIRQQALIADMTWSAAAILAHLSRLFELAPGDVILTGTPAGVGPVVPGDVLEGTIDGLPPLRVAVV